MQCNLVPFSAVGSLALSCPCRSSGLGPPPTGNRNCRPRERKLITHAAKPAKEQQNLQKRKLRKSGDIIGEGNEKSGKKKKKRERREEKRREEKTEERTKIPGSAEA